MARYVLVRWIDADLNLDTEFDPNKPGTADPIILETGGWLCSDEPHAIRFGMDRSADGLIRAIYTIPRPFILKVTTLAEFPDRPKAAAPRRKKSDA